MPTSKPATRSSFRYRSELPAGSGAFFNYLGEAALGAIAYVARLIAVTRPHIAVPDMRDDFIEQARRAAETDFSVLTRGEGR